MLLEGKNAVIYGAGGSVGGAVARTFAREGARVFLTGRTPEPLDAVATAIGRARGTVDTATVNALDVEAVCLRSMGSPESHGVQDEWEEHFGEGGTSIDDVVATRARGTLLRRVPTLAEVGNVAALMASDLASPLTAVVVNVACGEIAD